MARTRVDMRLEQADIELWDALAERYGVTRTRLVEQAMRQMAAQRAGGLEDLLDAAQESHEADCRCCNHREVPIRPRDDLPKEFEGGCLGAAWFARLDEARGSMGRRTYVYSAVLGWSDIAKKAQREWYRPRSSEAKRDVEVNLELLKEAMDARD